jgi:hypothetical protein
LIYEELVELAGFLGRSGGVKGRALAATDVSVEGELGNCQNASAHILEAAVHLSLIVFEDAEADNFFGEVVGIGFGVIPSDSEKNEQAEGNLAGDLLVNGNFGAAYALDDGTHSGLRLFDRCERHV